MSSLARPKRCSGFTLLELMIAVTVAGILLAIAIPSFHSMSVNSRLTSQANEIVSAITLARSEAIKRNANVTFCPADNASATSCSTSSGNWSNWIVLTSGGAVLRRGTVTDTIDVSSDLNQKIVFFSDGLARTGDTTLTLVSANQISIHASGLSSNNLRCITLGAGSRMSTVTQTGTSCS